MATALLATALVAGCGSRKTSDRDLVMVEPAAAMEFVAGRKKLFGLAGTESGAWVDPRSDRAFREGHIPGAVSLPFQELVARKNELKRYDVLIVYGDDYRDEKAEGMSKRLMELGFSDVRTLRGGLRAWKEAGFEVETGPPPG